jgi:hypothetical protein
MEVLPSLPLFRHHLCRFLPCLQFEECLYLTSFQVAIIFFTFPETKGHTLEEIDRLFDTKESRHTIDGIEKGHDIDEKSCPSVTDKEVKEEQSS